jgi:hypothetical protein
MICLKSTLEHHNIITFEGFDTMIRRMVIHEECSPLMGDLSGAKSSNLTFLEGLFTKSNSLQI